MKARRKKKPSLSVSSAPRPTSASATRRRRYSFCDTLRSRFSHISFHQKYHVGALTVNPLLVVLSFFIMLGIAFYHYKKHQPSVDDSLLPAGNEAGMKTASFSASMKSVFLTAIVLCVYLLLLQPTVFCFCFFVTRKLFFHFFCIRWRLLP